MQKEEDQGMKEKTMNSKIQNYYYFFIYDLQAKRK